MTSTTAARGRATETTTAITGQSCRTKRVDEIMGFVDTQRMRRKYEPGWFEEVETELHRKVMELERDLTAEIMAAHDVDAGAIKIEGKAHRRVLRAAQTYVTKAGRSVVERWLYRDRADDEAKSVSPMERRLGMSASSGHPRLRRPRCGWSHR